MERSDCPGCRPRDATIAALQQQRAARQARVRDLEERLGRNSSNSSLPPSANPPAAPAPVVKQPTGPKPGGQPGRTAHRRQRLPAERGRHVHPFVPTHCRYCQTALPAEAGPDDPAPSWQPVAERPQNPGVITEYQGQARTCLRWGVGTRAVIPAAIAAHRIGRRLAGPLAFWTGRCHLGKRALEEVVATVGDVPLALGTVGHLEQQLRQALAGADTQGAEAVPQAPVKNVAETGWKQAGRRRGLGAAVTSTAARLVVPAKRGWSGLAASLGETIRGRPRIEEQYPALTAAMEERLREEVAGSRQEDAKWVRSSVSKRAAQLRRQRCSVSNNAVGALRKRMGFSMRTNGRTRRGGTKDPAQRDEQFQYLRTQRQAFWGAGLPAIGVDTKKKEPIGNFKHQGRAWCRKAAAVDGRDLARPAECVATPFGV